MYLYLTVRLGDSEPRFAPPAAFFLLAHRFWAAARIFALVASDIFRRLLRLRGVSANGAAMLLFARPRFLPNGEGTPPNSVIRPFALSRTVPSAVSNVCR
jgi:hypothetical protein